MIPLAKQNIDYEELGKQLEQVIKSGWWGMGKVTAQLEEEFAKYVGTKYAIATNGCSTALLMGVRAGLERIRHSGNPNDRVVTTPLTFASTVNAIILNGLQPFLVDIRKDTLNIDEQKVIEIINYGNNKYSQCVGIIPVHFGGNPCNMDTFSALGDSFFIVQDCAHATETKWKGKHITTFGDCSAFSLGPIKNIATPDMGMVTTNDEAIANKVRSRRCHALSSDSLARVESRGDYDITDLGYKAHPTDVNAVFALQGLHNIRDNWFKREEIVFEYIKFFDYMKKGNLFNGKYYPSLLPAMLVNKDFHALHLFQITLNNRDKFIVEMKKRGIYCGIHYKPIHLHSYYAKKFGWGRGNFPNSEYIGDHIVSLPLGPGMTDADMQKVLGCCEGLLMTGEYLFD